MNAQPVSRSAIATLAALAMIALPLETLAFSESTTGRVTSILDQGSAECGSLEQEYQLDCLQQVYQRAQAPMSGKPDYDNARSEISRAQRSMKSLVDQNVDTAKPAKKSGGRTYRAVKKAAAAKVNRQAKAVIAETATKLLRSAGSAGERASHYKRIASSVDSTKKILRS